MDAREVYVEIEGLVSVRLSLLVTAGESRGSTLRLATQSDQARSLARNRFLGPDGYGYLLMCKESNTRGDNMQALGLRKV